MLELTSRLPPAILANNNRMLPTYDWKCYRFAHRREAVLFSFNGFMAVYTQTDFRRSAGEERSHLI